VSRGERFNAITHMGGAILAVAGWLVLVIPAVIDGDVKRFAGMSIYGLTLFLVYVASTLYHSVHDEAREVFRRYDRIAIYLVIAGTYTPVALLKLPPAWGWPLLFGVWAMAVAGSVIELVLGHQKRTLSVALYLLMGWMVLVAAKPLIEALSLGAVVWLGIGGVIYTLGAINLRFKLSPLSHEVWHVLVLAASACHFAAIFFYVR
jgi:hemolysin III